MPRGEIDLTSVELLRHDLLPAVGLAAVLVDLEAVAFIDSVGLAVLFTAAQRSRAAQQRFGVICPDPRMHRLLTVVALADVASVFTDLEAALEAFSGG